MFKGHLRQKQSTAATVRDHQSVDPDLDFFRL